MCKCKGEVGTDQRPDCLPLGLCLTTMVLPFFPGLRVLKPLALMPVGDMLWWLPLLLPRPPPLG